MIVQWRGATGREKGKGMGMWLFLQNFWAFEIGCECEENVGPRE